jgi:hypothetical protein
MFVIDRPAFNHTQHGLSGKNLEARSSISRSASLVLHHPRRHDVKLYCTVHQHQLTRQGTQHKTSHHFMAMHNLSS